MIRTAQQGKAEATPSLPPAAEAALGRELLDLGKLRELEGLSTNELMDHWSRQVTAELAMVEQAEGIRKLLESSLPSEWLEPDHWPRSAGQPGKDAVSLRVLSHPEAHPVPVDLESPVTRRLVGRALKEGYYQFKQKARRTADVDGRWWAVLTAAVWSICAKGDARRRLSASPASLAEEFTQEQAKALFLSTWPIVKEQLVLIWQFQRKDLGLDFRLDAASLAQAAGNGGSGAAAGGGVSRVTDEILHAVMRQVAMPASGDAEMDRVLMEGAFRMLLDVAFEVANDARQTEELLSTLKRQAADTGTAGPQLKGNLDSHPSFTTDQLRMGDLGANHHADDQEVGLEEVYSDIARKLAQQCQSNRSINDPMVRFRMFRILMTASKVAINPYFGDLPFERIARMGAQASQPA